MTVPSIRRACVMGHPVAQSRSPLLHGYWLEKLGLDGAYVKVDVPPQDFPDFLHKLRAKMEERDTAKENNTLKPQPVS